MGRKSISFKQIIKMSTFQPDFVQEAYVRNLSKENVESEELLLKRNLYYFSVDYDAIDKSDI